MSIYGAQTADAPKYDDQARKYDAILVMSFGGPEGPDDVMPFMENVTRGRNIHVNASLKCPSIISTSVESARLMPKIAH